MHFAFRADASLQIGAGHIMRCLTLADALRTKGAQCTFVCRPHAGHLMDLIVQRGHKALALNEPPANFHIPGDPAHAAWLGTSWADDAEQTKRALGERTVDWLVVDHYALDARWEKALRAKAQRIMIVDDLADRPHDCDMLLDQTFGRSAADYIPLVPDECKLLCGSNYVLLRPEFSALRAYSLKRRAQPVLKELLISMGGVDNNNATGQVLQAIRTCLLPKNCQITVVMGVTAPWLDVVRTQVLDMPWSTRVLVGVSDMAQLMADSDLAIGAAGATSWERCCLGLPTVMLVLAENQRPIATELERTGAAKLTELGQIGTERFSVLFHQLANDPGQLMSMSKCAASVVGESGVGAVMRQIGY